MESIPSMQTKIPGFRFRPYDDELITDYLLKKIKGEALPWEGIVECDIYGERSPWEICGDLSDPEEKVYFFTRRKKLSKNRVGRTAGCGVWHENSTVKIYDYKGDAIGVRKLFSFMVKQGTCKKKSDWIMHEFSLIGEQEQDTDWVLCNIQNKGLESRVGIQRRLRDHQSCIGQVTPITIVSFETETPQPLTNPNVLLHEDESRQRKRMRCDVECDVPQAIEMPSQSPSEFGTPQSKFTPSQDSVDIGEVDVETSTTLPANDNSDSQFFPSNNYLHPPCPEGGHLPLNTCIDFSNVFYVDVDDFMSSLPVNEDSDNCMPPLPFSLPVGTCVHFSDLFDAEFS
jgi:hypothetical protein